MRGEGGKEREGRERGSERGGREGARGEGEREREGRGKSNSALLALRPNTHPLH